MNSLGIILAWAAVQVTLLVMLTALLCLIAGRRRPEAGVVVAAVGLSGCIALTILAICPLPAWWTWSRAESPEMVTTTDNLAATKTEPANVSHRMAESKNRAGWMVPLAALRQIAEQLTTAGLPPDTASWRWPEIGALLYLALVGAGLMRLALGLVAVQGLRRRSRRLQDPVVSQLVAALEMDMLCSRRVDVRETADLSTAATVGWLRPLILLPMDWRSWSEPEVRAVLAHEFAHICRADYATWLLARLSGALHSYHPLVCWLIHRLQLQQELAADALGAACAGGREMYAKALARLALRQDGRPLLSPARAFLPARGTLMRRIDMLRQGQGVSARPASWRGRFGWLMVLGAIALGVSALRSPAQNIDDPSPKQEPAPAEAASVPAPARPPFLFAGVRKDALALFAVRPAVIFSQPDLKKVADEWMKKVKQFLKPFDLDSAIPSLTQIEQCSGLVFLSHNPKAPKGAQHSVALTLPIIRTTSDYDWTTLIDALKRSEKFLKLICKKAEEVTYEGKTYYRLIEAPMFGDMHDACIGLVDRHTLVISTEDDVKKVLRDGPATAPDWAQKAGWQHVENSCVALALDNRRGGAKEMLDPEETPPAEVITLVDKTVCAVFGGDWNGKLRLDAYATANDQDAKQIAAATRRSLVMAGEAIDKELQKSHTPADWRMLWAKQLLTTGDVHTDLAGGARKEAQVHVHLQAALNLAEWVEFLRDAGPMKKK